MILFMKQRYFKFQCGLVELTMVLARIARPPYQRPTDPEQTSTMKTAMDELVSSTKDLTVDNDNNDSTSSSTPFINTGLHRWESIRSAWLASCTKQPAHATDIDVDEVIDLIVSNRWRQQPPPSRGSTSSLDTARSATRRRDEACFEKPVGLPMMVDVLVDLWEAEGLDI